jgi:two-component system alkaline phosphatase synthesis response regulator PhoP
MTAKILIADDQPQIRNLVKAVLGKDYEVVQAASGQEAIKVARETLPDLIIMDILMPGMDGLTACSQLKADPTTAKIPVLVLTIIDYDLNRRFAENLGADGYITKPFTHDQLKQTVARYLKKPAPEPGATT